MNTRTQLTFVLAAILLLLLGWLAGGSGNVVEAQSADPLLEWRMFGGNVAGTGGSGGSDSLGGLTGRAVTGATWLYNAKSGKVYRVWEKCNEDDGGGSGCLIAAPVFSADRLDVYLPNPATDNDLPGLER